MQILHFLYTGVICEGFAALVDCQGFSVLFWFTAKYCRHMREIFFSMMLNTYQIHHYISFQVMHIVHFSYEWFKCGVNVVTHNTQKAFSCLYVKKKKKKNFAQSLQLTQRKWLWSLTQKALRQDVFNHTVPQTECTVFQCKLEGGQSLFMIM